MTFRRIFAATWIAGALLGAAGLIALGWRGEAPRFGDLNAWLAFAWALFLGVVFSAIPAALFSAALLAAATKHERLSHVAALTRRGRRRQAATRAPGQSGTRSGERPQ